MIRTWFSLPRLDPAPDSTLLLLSTPGFSSLELRSMSCVLRVAHLSVQSGLVLRGLVHATALVFLSAHYRGVESEHGTLLMLEFEADWYQRMHYGCLNLTLPVSVTALLQLSEHPLQYECYNV